MIQAHRQDARVPLILLALVTPPLVLTLIFCRAGRLNWLLEVAPALLGYVALAATYRRLRLSDFCYVAVFLHTLVLLYGAYYTYAGQSLGQGREKARAHLIESPALRERIATALREVVARAPAKPALSTGDEITA